MSEQRDEEIARLRSELEEARRERDAGVQAIADVVRRCGYDVEAVKADLTRERGRAEAAEERERRLQGALEGILNVEINSGCDCGGCAYCNARAALKAAAGEGERDGE